MTSSPTAATDELNALAKGGRTNIAGFIIRLVARMPFLFIAGRWYGADAVGRLALAVVVIEFASLVATLGLKRGFAQALAQTERPHAHVVWDGMVVAAIASALVGALLIAFPRVMYPSGDITLIERLFPIVILFTAWSDVALAALAYRHNVKASVTARAVIEPWTISAAAGIFWYVDPRNGLVLSYMVAMAAAFAASLIPLIRSYGLPHGWTPHLARVFMLARHNIPLAAADAIEWLTRNVDRFILGVLFPPSIVGIYYMAQQLSSIPQKLKSSFDPIMGPVITTAIARGDKAAIAAQVRQVGFWVMSLQICLALMASIPGEAVMGLVGPHFVAGTAALGILLWAEVLASTGSVCESALVYVARHRNLMISAGVLLFQIALSFALVAWMRSLDWEHSLFAQLGKNKDAVQGASVAVALLVALTIGSIVKSNFLAHLLKARVAGWRWSMLIAIVAALVVGEAFAALPKRYEWIELSVGLPAILITYLSVLWLWVFRPADRALIKSLEGNA